MLAMIDNYDSFTHNLVRYFRELGQEVEVLRNDQVSLQQLRDMAPAALLISPGPGTPNDAGISLAAIEQFAGEIPILGVCLGHQAIAQVFGADVVSAKQVMHGKRSPVRHSGKGIFSGIASPYQVTRYHSLAVAAESLPTALVVDAWIDDGAVDGGEIMAVRHRDMPVYGVQFHPESVVTEHGHTLLANFCRLAGLPVDVDIDTLAAGLS
ncbi:anthranilate synthase component II [Aliidiomarina soli]|uniref:Anthranilate/aminodeoxychorismate synthase component II n=1 Tax=Aliidiomarina soli TaxID=1928574 RepID=A0A432WFK4_9GAMM|nr:aminodeoxychorismate/anthranilate synthase component II [Aliidiomarina soli]RUO32586.1 anthranilate/aminodeoxychorismate synthase component II [Aliidiomarina soli]